MAARVDGDGEGKMRKGTWTEEEDAMLAEYVRRHGEGNWNAVQRNSGLRRCGKSCRLRWANHLRPNLKKGSFSPEEERLIVELHARLGNKWARMASMMPGRTDNEIKNYWNTRKKKRRRQRLPLYSYQHPSLSAPSTPTTTSSSAAPIPFQFQPYNPPPHPSLPSPLGFKRFRGCSHDSLLPPLSPAVPLPPSLQTAPPAFPVDNSSLSHFLPPKAPQLPPLDFNVMEFDMDSELQSSRKRSMSDMNMSIFTDQDSDGLLEDLLAESCHGQNLFGLQNENDTSQQQQFHQLHNNNNFIGCGDNSHPMVSFSEGVNGDQNNIDNSAMNYQISSTDGEDLSKLLGFLSSGDTCKAQFSSEDQLNCYTQQPEAGSWDNLPEFC